MGTRNIKYLIAVLLFVAGCATGGLTRQDVLHQYAAVNDLSTELADIEGKESALLTPEAHERAHALLEEAVERAANADKTEANRLAKEGLSIVKQAVANMKIASEELSEVLAVRERARMAGADSLFKGTFKKADEEVREATSMIEGNMLPAARKLRPELMKLYADLEVKALKKGTRKAAEAAIKKAKKMDADRYAPKTFDNAIEELALVDSVLETDRAATKKADVHARNARWMANRAMAIARLTKVFEEADYNTEDMILWHQKQLEYVNRSLDVDLPFDESDSAAVKSLEGSVTALLAAIGDMRKVSSSQRQQIAEQSNQLDLQRISSNKKINELLASHQQQLEELNTQFVSMIKASKKELASLQKEAAEKIADVKSTYDQELAAQAKAEAEAARRREASEKNFEDVRNLFAVNEAVVVRDGDNVLINAHGFDFPRGSIEIGAKNYSMLDKIVSVLNTFPKAKVVITGHTDSTGNRDRNLRLSMERADSVAKFLTTVGNIKPDRVQANGLGESAPVATNDTKEGRIKNRRIEVLIANEKPPH